MKEVKPKAKARKKVRYEVTFTPALLTKTFDFMSKMDLGITGGEYPHTLIYSWNTTSKTDPAYYRKMNGAIRAGLKAQGVTQIHSIKRIK